MIKIFGPILLFILIIYGIAHYWEKAKQKQRKKIAFVLGSLLLIFLSITTYLIIN